MLLLILSSALVMLASLVGVIFVWRRAGQLIERNLSLLVSFSAGVFIVIAYELGGEAVGHASSATSGFLWILAGALVFTLLFKILPSFHHHHDDGVDAHPHSALDARRIIAGDALHNVGDGILLAASFAVSSSLGFLTALSIFVHELVQETSEFFVLKQAGYSAKKALGVNFLVSSTILIGSLGGYFLLELFEAIEAPLLGIAAGAFLVVVLYDLIPHSVRASKEKNIYLKHFVWFILGALLMCAVSFLAGH